jgi:hypothetical protein
MSSSASFKLYHMCGYVGLRGGIRGRGGASRWWERVQLIPCLGQEWRKVRTLALKATTPNKVFFVFESPTCLLLYLVCIILYSTVYIILLCVFKNKLAKGVMKHVFFLGPVSMVV